MRDGAVPADVVAGARLDDVIALGHPELAAQDQMVLVAGVSMGARPRPSRGNRFDDRDPAGEPAVDPFHPAKVIGLDRTLGATDHRRCRRVLEEEPGNRDLEGVGQCGEAGQ